MKHVDVFTDGACSGNPGPGGYGIIMKYKDTIKEFSGGAAQTTNNRMEMTAVIEALSKLKESCEVTVYSDSKYVIDAVTKGWAKSWQKKNWVKSDKKRRLIPSCGKSCSDCLTSTGLNLYGSRVTQVTRKMNGVTSLQWNSRRNSKVYESMNRRNCVGE